MISLPRPGYSAIDSFTLCVSRVRDVALRARFDAAVGDIGDAAAAYEVAMEDQEGHRVPRVAPFSGLTQEELDKVYTGRMAKPKAVGRLIYDALRAAAPNGKCPLCVHRNVTTLDHHLPRAHYPGLSVTPLNLIPSCFECNKAKLAGFPLTAVEVTLHPYFDAVDDHEWLTALVLQTTPAATTFSVAEVDAWDDDFQTRVESHFKLLGLGRLYEVEAAEELLNVRGHLNGLALAGGRQAVRAHLQDIAASCRNARRNGWRTTTYLAWAQSDWFCDGGFAL